MKGCSHTIQLLILDDLRFYESPHKEGCAEPGMPSQTGSFLRILSLQLNETVAVLQHL